jgi:protein-tyrosine-phosphatase
MHARKQVLFLCVANAARSQLAEASLRHLAPARFEAFSAGTAPTSLDPRTLHALRAKDIDTDGLRCKSIDEFAGRHFDYLITLCDKSALECRALPQASEIIAWNFEDPATSRKPDAFDRALHEIQERIKMFLLVNTKR